MYCFKIFIVLNVFLFLGGCAFKPLYTEKDECINNQTCAHRLTIKVNKNGYNSLKLQKMLETKKHLIDEKLTYNATLTVAVSEEFDSVGMSVDGLTTRGQGRINVALTLTSNDAAMPRIKTSQIDQVSSYNLDGGDSFTFDRTQSSVRERLLTVLSDQIVRETLYLVE
jgi:hypothetical protein